MIFPVDVHAFFESDDPREAVTFRGRRGAGRHGSRSRAESAFWSSMDRTTTSRTRTSAGRLACGDGVTRAKGGFKEIAKLVFEDVRLCKCGYELKPEAVAALRDSWACSIS